MVQFEMQKQCHSNWCWAAVAASIAAFYDRDSGVRQCDLANLELERDDCCNADCQTPGVAFNVTNVFASPLNRVGCLQKLTRFQQAAPSQVLEQLQARRPICVRTVWPDGGAHFLTIIGFLPDAEGGPIIAVDDPFWGRSEYSYDRFSKDYQLIGGKWNDTYYTKPPPRIQAAAARGS
jgi:hypothetical protein